MSKRLIERLILSNGLALELWDQSHLIAGDRWLVSLLATVEIPVLPEYFSAVDDSQKAYQDTIAAYGDKLVFSQEKVRHFVDEGETENVLAGLRQRLKDNLAGYISNPKFASRYALKKYGDLQERVLFKRPPPSEEL